MKKRSYYFGAAVFICFILVLSACSTNSNGNQTDASENGDVSLTMGTSSSGGSVYQVGAGVASVLTDVIPELNVRAVSTNGAVDNVGLMSRGEVELAMNASNTSALAYEGELEGMEAQENLRGIASIYPSTFHFVSLKSKGFESIEDLAGTTGGVGASGSGTDGYTQHVLGHAGIDYKTRDDIEAVYSDASSAADQLKDGHIDWAHFPLGVPGSTVMDLALTDTIDIIPIEGSFRDGLVEENPYYIPYTIPGGTYEGFDDPIETIAGVITLVVDESASEDLVYEITKALWENLDDVKKINNAIEWMDLDNAFEGIGVPLHPGAERYYKEIDVIE